MDFRDLKKQYQILKTEIDQEIHNVIENANFISGAKITELETKLAEYTGNNYCVTCANGTDALSLALMSWGITSGDAVFVPDFTFFSSAEVISLIGATPIFVDVNPETLNIDTNALEKSINYVLEEGIFTPRAVIAVDLFGLPADYHSIRKLTKKYQLLLLEDGAQGFGGSIYSQKACSFGDISTTSFFPAKPLGCYGDGGAVFTNNEELYKKIRSLHIHGKGNNKYDNLYIGINSRLDTLQAAILLPKLKAFQEYELDSINRVASYYTNHLTTFVKTIQPMEPFYSSWAQYTIQLNSSEERNQLQICLREKDIPSVVHYPKPLHLQPAFAYLDRKFECPISEHLSQTVLSLPLHPYIEKSDQDLVIKTIIDFLQKYRGLN